MTLKKRAGRACWPRRISEATIGTTVNATTSEATITMLIVKAMFSRYSLKRPPVDRKINGMNTHIVVIVEAMIGSATSLVPRSAAVTDSSSSSLR